MTSLHPVAVGNYSLGSPPDRPDTAILLQRSDHQGLYQQFQSRYPAAGLIAELLHIHDGKYIVRAVVQVGGVTLATGLASAYTPELAEDHARARALEILGIYPKATPLGQVQATASPPAECEVQLMPTTTTYSLEGDSTKLRQSVPHSKVIPGHDAPVLQGSFLEEAIEMQPLTPRVSAQTLALSNSATEFEIHPESDRDRESTGLNSTYAGNPNESAAALSRNRSSKATPSSRRMNPVPTQPAPIETDKRHKPMDLSDEIAQTSVEMKRLGWNESQGRTHLQRTYGKRSRQQLTPEELLDFLHYLQDQPSATESLF